MLFNVLCAFCSQYGHIFWTTDQRLVVVFKPATVAVRPAFSSKQEFNFTVQVFNKSWVSLFLASKSVYFF
jgi:hypothetical protein